MGFCAFIPVMPASFPVYIPEELLRRSFSHACHAAAVTVIKKPSSQLQQVFPADDRLFLLRKRCNHL